MFLRSTTTGEKKSERLWTEQPGLYRMYDESKG